MDTKERIIEEYRKLEESFSAMPDKEKRRIRYAGGVWFTSDVETLVELFGIAELRKYRKFVDLGVGDGRALVIASTLFGVEGVGIERNEWLFEKAQEMKKTFSDLPEIEKVTFVKGDYMQCDFSDCDFVFAFLDLETIPSELEEKLFGLKSGSKVVLHRNCYGLQHKRVRRQNIEVYGYRNEIYEII